MSRTTIVGEIWGYLKLRKRLWLLPLILLLLGIGALVIFSEGSAIAPMIYAIF